MMGAVLDSELAWIGLGANVGSPRIMLQRAVSALSGLPAVSVAAVSPLYRTRPVGPVSQGDFLNAVVGLWVSRGDDASRGAMELLVELKDLERVLGRLERELWGPREIDLDLLLYGAHRLRLERDEAARSNDPARGGPARSGPRWLEVPHPAARERLFVLAPLADVAPELVPPGWDESVTQARARALAAEGPDAVTLVGSWDATRGTWI